MSKLNDNSIKKLINIPGRRKVLTKGMVERAQENTKSAMSAARWLNVSYNTYKKWAKYYGIFEQHKNQSGVGIKKGWATYKIPMEKIFNGEVKPNYSLKVIKNRLVEEGYFQEECSLCSWNEERITDSKICLTLDFVDGDITNKSLNNMRLLCSNCYFTNVGNFHNSKKFCK